MLRSLRQRDFRERARGLDLRVRPVHWETLHGNGIRKKDGKNNCYNCQERGGGIDGLEVP